VGHCCILKHRYTVQWSNRVAIEPLKSASRALVQEGVSDDVNVVHHIPLPDYDQDVDPELLLNLGGYPPCSMCMSWLPNAVATATLF